MEQLRIISKTISPEQAKKYLEKNNINRHLSERWVNIYLAQMTAGEWMNTGDTIKFAEDGTLLDGQHRLHAIVHYGKPIDCFVAENVPKDAFQVLDTGKVRSAGDVLAIQSFDKPKIVGAVSRFILLFNGGYYAMTGGNRGEVVNNTKILEFATANQIELAEVIDYIKDVYVQSPRGLTISYLGMLYWILSHKNQASADIFFEKYATGVELSKTSPIRLLRERYMRDKLNKSKLPIRDKMALFILAWNAYRERKPLTQLSLVKNYKFPRPI